MKLFCSIFILTFICLVHSVVIKVENLPEKCDYSKCAKWDPTKINVHLVPHTHDDVGWLKTVDQYYYGLKMWIQKAGVQFILDTVVEELIRNKDRRFIYVETAFFWRWWQEQDQEMRAVVRELVQTGQLEFINGGWSMPDEATTHYNSLIDQSTWGLRRLNDTFGRCGQPRVTWQIDPFGHSRELANLYAQMNYDALFFAREDYQDRENRMKTKTLEHVWQGSDDLGAAGDLFTGMMMSGYGPIEFNWDIVGGQDDSIVDNPESEEYNVPKMVEKLVKHAKLFKRFYATPNVMFPMGTDFQYMGAHMWFKNLDKLIKHVNEISEKTGVRAFYSTPSCYAKALNEVNRTWTGKTDDYFPYASDEHAYWTGYFTSRPAVKRMERVGNNLLQACKQIDVWAGNQGRYELNITKLREAMGVMQHHDAVTGTEKQEVAYNYAKHLHSAMVQCEHVISESYKQLFPESKENHQFCHYLNISSCPATETSVPVTVYIYNPLGHNLTNYLVRFPVLSEYYYYVRDGQDKPVNSVLVPIPDYVQHIPGRQSQAKKELVFRVPFIPALGVTRFRLHPTKQQTEQTAKDVKRIPIHEEVTLKSDGGRLQIKFDNQGLISNVIRDGNLMKFKTGFHYYQGFSGAYIFLPQQKDSFPVFSGKRVESVLYLDDKYGLVQEVHQKFNGSWIDQIIKLDEKKDHIEFEFVVGPIPVDDGVGKEVFTRYQTDLDAKETFLTDANGRQMLTRKWNYRPTWKYEVEELISGNYYPVASRIAIQDHKQNMQMTVLTDRSQGGSLSPDPLHGSVDLMVHRRLLFDDGFGVGEALDEPGVDGRGLVIRAKHFVLFDNPTIAATKHRPLAQQLFMEPIFSFVKQDQTNKMDLKSALTTSLPDNVHLLTLEQWHSNGYLLRLEHFYQKQDDPDHLSKPVTVSVKNLFNSFIVTDIRELTLGANQDVSRLKNRMVFKFEGQEKREPNLEESDDENVLENGIKLNPMQIRTFFLRVQRK